MNTVNNEVETEKEDGIEITPEIKMDEPIYWDGLIEMQAAIAKTMIEQQLFVLELSKKYKDALESDKSIFHAVSGLMLSIGDLAADLAGIQNLHKVDGAYRTGEINDIDGTMDYLRIASNYIAIEENLSNLMASAYLDIFSRLNIAKTNIDELATTVIDGKQNIIDAHKEITDGK